MNNYSVAIRRPIIVLVTSIVFTCVFVAYLLYVRVLSGIGLWPLFFSIYFITVTYDLLKKIKARSIIKESDYSHYYVATVLNGIGFLMILSSFFAFYVIGTAPTNSAPEGYQYYFALVAGLIIVTTAIVLFAIKTIKNRISTTTHRQKARKNHRP